MTEERRSVKAKGFEDLYDVTISGRIIPKKTNIPKFSNNNEYGFKNVHLYNKDKKELFKTYELWKDVFGSDCDDSEYKGKK